MKCNLTFVSIFSRVTFGHKFYLMTALSYIEMTGKPLNQIESILYFIIHQDDTSTPVIKSIAKYGVLIIQ